MLEIFHIHPEKLLILFAYIVKSKTIIQETQLFIILDLSQFLYQTSFYKFFLSLLILQSQSFFQAGSCFSLFNNSLLWCRLFVLLQMGRNLDSILDKEVGYGFENKRKQTGMLWVSTPKHKQGWPFKSLSSIFNTYWHLNSSLINTATFAIRFSL